MAGDVGGIGDVDSPDGDFLNIRFIHVIGKKLVQVNDLFKKYTLPGSIG